MSDRRKKEREKQIQDRLQVFLTKMLQDEDNKYCVDCDSKGPRWASWNLGIFLCIRCAGIHRNLGVHISRVKSVNLDTWTPQQVASMQMMGNSKARSVYEAQVPDDFRRPQSDSQLEVFIRAKYERKKYLAHEWNPPPVPEFPVGWNDTGDGEKPKKDVRPVNLPPVSSPVLKSPSALQSSSAAAASMTKAAGDTVPSGQSLSSDLLGLSIHDSSSQPAFTPITSQTQATPEPAKSKYSNDLLCLESIDDQKSTSLATSSNSSDLFGSLIGGGDGGGPAAASAMIHFSNNLHSKSDGNLSGSHSPFTVDSTNTNGNQSKMSKDSIMALFNQPGKTATVDANNSLFNSMAKSSQKIHPFSNNYAMGTTPQGHHHSVNSHFLPGVSNPFMSNSTPDGSHLNKLNCSSGGLSNQSQDLFQ